jgi:CRISPR-associated Csx2 family protein
MAKILISSIGVGGSFQNKNNPDTTNFERSYRGTTYKIDGKDYPNGRFVASVLYQHFNLDGIILIGTVKSMWEEVYRYYSEINGIEKNDDYWLNLACKIDELKYDSPLDSLDLSPIEQVLGRRSRCILIKYGLDENELWQNLDNFFKIVDFLKKGDEIYLDITHSFRSISLFIFLTTTFLKDLVDEKEIKIGGVYYGMLDITNEIGGYTPIVDLKSLFDMTSWIKGAYSLKSYGDGYLIAELLKNQGETTIANDIEQLSKAIDINNVNEIKQKSSNLKKSLSQQQTSQNPFKYIRGVLDKFITRFARSSVSESEYQLELATWYFNNRRYGAGYIVLTEAIITYMCEMENRDIKNKDDRELMKNLLHKNYQTTKLANLYFEINPIRNSIAHALLNDRNSQSVHNSILKSLEYCRIASQVFKSKTIC